MSNIDEFETSIIKLSGTHYIRIPKFIASKMDIEKDDKVNISLQSENRLEITFPQE